MKKYTGLIGLVIMLIVVGQWLYSGEGKALRLQGGVTVARTYKMVMDSTENVAKTDTDTIYSDTFDFEDYAGFYEYNYVHVTLIRDTIVACSTCHDSVVVATTVWTRQDGGFDKQLASDVPAADRTNDTASLRFYINGDGQIPHPDSTVYDQIWVRTIITDSIWHAAQVVDTAETLYYKGEYYLWFSK